ncbi:MAG: DUF2911 domain-containing protein [Phycisphaerae bacterium]|nr:DUF2911 domain-containing protein [Gemmatimonadaceae bacterium]
MNAKSTRMFLVASLLAASATSSSVAQAQSEAAAEPRKSQAGFVSQTVASTTISVKYIRPVARGRELFGGIVKWDKEWTPSADSAALLTITRPILINGAKLEAGTYSLWAKPGRDKWVMIFSNAQPVFHTPYPGNSSEVMRIEATPRASSHMETLAFYFPTVDGKKAELVLHWGSVVVPFTIEVP